MFRSRRLQPEEAFLARPPRQARLPGERPEVFRRLDLPAQEAKPHRVVVHSAFAGGYAGADGHAVPNPDNWQYPALQAGNPLPATGAFNRESYVWLP
jgi:hypothetical protein